MSVGHDHRTLREVVAEEITALILRGELEPGLRLYEDKIADQLGVSRNPVREALRALEATGLVEVIPRRGAYVAQFDHEDLCQVLLVRSRLEGYAAELAAERHTEEDLAELDRCISEGAAASKRGDLATAARCHRNFHLTVERAAGNPHLATTVTPLRQRSELVFSLLADGRSMLSWSEHQRIRDAIADRKPELAMKRATEHMTAVIDDLRGAASAPQPRTTT